MSPMWMAELSSRSGLSVPTIKYYLREGLLHPGESTGATRARYDESHIARLTLIRALSDIAGLKLETVRSVLTDIDQAKSDGHWRKAVGIAHDRLIEPGDASPTSLARVQELLERSGWTLRPDNPLRAMLARALDALDDIGHTVGDDILDVYAQAMRDVGRAEIGLLPDGDPEAAASMAIAGTLLLEPVVLAVRRIAEQNAAMEKL